MLDADFVFDAAHGIQNTFSFGTGGTLKLTMDGTGGLGTGYKGIKSIRIADGISIASSSGCLGYYPNSKGIATVTGIGSKWTNSGELIVGYGAASGTLNIEAGGEVTNNQCYLGNNSDSTGTATISGTGSKWTNSYLYFGASGGTGRLNILEGGEVSDRVGVLGSSSGSIGTATVSGIGSKWTNSYSLYVGDEGSGMLNIEAGGQVTSSDGILGQLNNSTGRAMVIGTGSTWNISGVLSIGNGGKGTLTIEAGGQVSNYFGYLGYNSGTGTATVIGTGSKWINSSTLRVGYNGTGTLNIVGGGTVTATSININYKSLLAIDAGTGSTLNVGNGTGTITNNGKVRILSGANNAAGNVYAPISAGTWSGMGIYQAVGGTWNATSHEFTVSGVQAGNSGFPVNIDLLFTQRAMIEDNGSGWRLGASFLASASSKPLTFTATAVSGGTLDALQTLAGPGQTVLGGWTLKATAGYAAGDPVYLSFDTGGRYSRELLQLWSYNGTSWTEFAANDVNFDGKYVNFTITGMSTYAATVPEPGTVVLMICGLMGLAGLGWRKRKKGMVQNAVHS
jgi:T5SS/PEP-CTERM-associated repeat protein